jgi:hypothetical protein
MRTRGLEATILPRENARPASVCEDVETLDIGSPAGTADCPAVRLPLEPRSIDTNVVFVFPPVRNRGQPRMA